MIELTQSLQSLITNRTHRFAVCWRITRRDGLVYRFTNHDSSLYIGALLYTPAGGLDASARERQDALRERNLQLKGVLNSLAITEADLRAGKFRGAKCEEMLVDWRYPWAGILRTCSYWITQVRWTSEGWVAELEGLTYKLKQKVGRLYGRTCQWRLGDANCKKSTISYRFSGTVTAITTQRQMFETDVSQATNWFKYGYLTWASGNNDTLTCEIARSWGTAGRIRLLLKTVFDIQVGDTFQVYAGCDRTLATCKTKFANTINFGGFPYVPGNDRMLGGPDTR